VESSRVCPKCGHSIVSGLPGPQGAQGPEGRVVCRCSRPRRYWLHSRETILLLSVGGLVIAFAVTGFAARLYHGRRAELARSWFDRGNADVNAGRAAQAVSDLRTALVYAQHELPAEQQQEYQLKLAEALPAMGSDDEAKAYLLDLWERAPGNSRVNLELARLAANTGEDADAKRYYNGAIYGVWDESAEAVLRSRMDARLEFFRYLTSRGETTEAQGVLLATAAETPPEPALHAEVGRLMLQSGQPQHALEQFELALKLDPHDYEALAGMGEAYFALGNDRDAVRSLESAAREGAQRKRHAGEATETAASETEEAQVTQDLAIAQATQALDPHRPGLEAMERAARAIRAYDSAEMRMRS
jgi:tetratricopeptide (TPR) repeat protein